MAKETAKERFLTIEEITRLLEACATSKNKALSAIVTLALHTGLRKTELLTLRWEQVDLSRGAITLGRSTKSKKGREVPINATAYAVLAPLRASAGGIEATGRVWRTIGTKIDKAYTGALARARIFDPEVDFHTLRRTFASWYTMRGGSLATLQVILGHASIRTTMIYARLDPRHAIGSTDILGGLGVSTTSAHGVSENDAETAPHVEVLENRGLMAHSLT